MNEINTNQEQEVSEPFFASKNAELLSAAMVIALSTIGKEAFGPEIGPVTIALHGILFGGLKAAWEEGATLEEMKSKEGLKYMLKESIKAAALPFLTAGAINNAELIGNTLENINQTIGLTDGLSKLINEVIQGIKDYGPKLAGGAAIASAGVTALKKAGDLISKSYRNAKSSLNNLELNNPFKEMRSPIKVELQRPNVQGFIKKKRLPEGEE